MRGRELAKFLACLSGLVLCATVSLLIRGQVRGWLSGTDAALCFYVVFGSTGWASFFVHAWCECRETRKS